MCVYYFLHYSLLIRFLFRLIRVRVVQGKKEQPAATGSGDKPRRGKIDIKRIENTTNRQVTFCKSAATASSRRRASSATPRSRSSSCPAAAASTSTPTTGDANVTDLNDISVHLLFCFQFLALSELEQVCFLLSPDKKNGEGQMGAAYFDSPMLL